ncbi:hypothetical protein ACFLRF_02295 [Candidatus Altiarchaeota archaeon]
MAGDDTDEQLRKLKKRFFPGLAGGKAGKPAAPEDGGIDVAVSDPGSGVESTPIQDPGDSIVSGGEDRLSPPKGALPESQKAEDFFDPAPVQDTQPAPASADGNPPPITGAAPDVGSEADVQPIDDHERVNESTAEVRETPETPSPQGRRTMIFGKAKPLQKPAIPSFTPSNEGAIPSSSPVPDSSDDYEDDLDRFQGKELGAPPAKAPVQASQAPGSISPPLPEGTKATPTIQPVQASQAPGSASPPLPEGTKATPTIQPVQASQAPGSASPPLPEGTKATPASSEPPQDPLKGEAETPGEALGPAPEKKQEPAGQEGDPGLDEKYEDLKKKYVPGSISHGKSPVQPADAGEQGKKSSISWTGKVEKVMQGGGGSRIPAIPPINAKIIVPALIIILILGLAYMFYPSSTSSTTMYQCPMGGFVSDPTKCPRPETTSTTRPPIITLPPMTTTTTIYMTTTTQPKINCTTNEDCRPKTPYVPYCDGLTVKKPYAISYCMKQGTPESYCVIRASAPKLIKKCGEKQYCWTGECYPEHCRNHKLDDNEILVDCGGPCEDCTIHDSICHADLDCGQQDCGNYYCIDGDVYQNCTKPSCIDPTLPNATCVNQDIVALIDECGRGEICVQNQDDCMKSGAKANCHDCIRNQGEAGTDCGGPCPACAIRPTDSTPLNLSATEGKEFERYSLSLQRLLRSETCTTGANVKVQSPDGPWQTEKVTYYQSAEIFGLEFGIIDADSSMITLWVKRTT